MLGAAIAFARHGHPVLPLTWPIKVNGRLVCSCRKAADCVSPAKHPLARLVSRGLLDASTDETVIRRWFTNEPNANLGVVTDKLIVLDIDPRHDGDGSLAELERDHEFPPTWRALTGGGGEHLIYKRPDGVTVNSSIAETNPVLGAGIDIRAHGGYVVAPPSRHINGRHYSWSVDHHPADVRIAEAPPWLIERLAVPVRQGGNGKARIAPETWERLTCEPVREYRDDAAARLLGKLLSHGLDTSLAVGLVRAWNVSACQPPLGDAILADIVTRICRREAEKLERAQ